MSFPIVGIGASAGGLEAVSELLGALPPRSGMAYILIQHLDPDHESLLPEILTKRTAIPVTPAYDGQAVQPDHVFVIPSNTTLTLKAEQLQLVPRAPAPARHMPVDALFRSLAEERADSVIGIVLSGGDGDGALGIQAIKHRGGITFAQDPASARFASMPRSAIETGCVDFVLPPIEIAHELMLLGQHPYLRAGLPRQPPADPPDGAEALQAHEEENLRQVFRELRSVHGVDFTHYKRNTLRRRLARRMALRKIDNPADYIELIKGDPTELATLYQDFLIRVTGFFRDPESFEVLAQRVFPSLCEGRSPREPIRIWVPGCATGEEAYSIAIALVEYLGDRPPPAGLQVFGTDVSEAAIEKARAGRYLDTISQEVSAERLSRFFAKQGDYYQIAKSVRELCIFARQDVTRDPPFSRLDLVSCRNLLIYLDTTAQRRVMRVFHYALRPQGFLMLGPSESVGQASDLFELTDKQRRLYARKSTSAAGLDLGEDGSAPSSPPREAEAGAIPVLMEAESAQREADRLLLARFAPASLLVDEALNILQFRGETGPYIEPASGPPSPQLNRVVRPELMVEIAPAIEEARTSGTEARREGLRVDELLDVSIEVVPLKRMSAERCYLILLEDGARRPSGRRAQAAAASALSESEKDRRLAQSERETASIREYLQATMEEHEAVKEELKSAHEEVLSANEEFQSTNEELETAKEELQSANEELTTTNDELRNRNRQLAVTNTELDKARSYADAIVETMRDPLLVLDSKLKVQRANRAFYAYFIGRPDETEGRLLYEVGRGQWNIPSLRARLEAVLAHDEPMVEFELAHDFGAIGPRVMCLTARRITGDAGREELMLLSMEDITERRANTETLREGSRRKDEFLAMLAHELRNPLTPITHAIHLLRRADQDRDANDSSQKLHEMIERQTQRLVRLVDELLDVARISRGIIELKRELVDLVALVRHTAESGAARIEERRHTLALTLPSSPVLVDGDAVRLEQVVANLLENAIKYTEPGGRIALTLTEDQSEAVLSVRDTGIGLAPETLESIFDLFTQVDNSPARAGGGLGLGLTVVRRVLELHRGRIEAHSSGLGHGSEFIVRLPRLPALHNASRAEGPPGRQTPATADARRVLIVDDNEDSAQSLALLARSWGHEVAVAQDGASALTLAAQFKPEIALVDIGLPGMNGYELARRLREHPIHGALYLVAMTGYGREEDRSAARAAGFDVHLIKPADPDKLQMLIANGASVSATTAPQPRSAQEP